MLGQQVEYPCEVREVFSGDDLIVMIDLGVENLFMKRRIRLHGVDTPNAVKEQKDTDAGKIRTLVRTLTRGRKAKLQVVSRNQNSWVVTLIVDTPEGQQVNVNDFLISKGYEFKR